MNCTISSIHYCPVKSISFQSIQSCEIKENLGIANDRIFKVTKIQAEDCVKPGCGLIWRVD